MKKERYYSPTLSYLHFLPLSHAGEIISAVKDLQTLNVTKVSLVLIQFVYYNIYSLSDITRPDTVLAKELEIVVLWFGP